MEKIRVVIADDQEIFRDGLKLVIERSDRYILIGEAADGRELLGIVEREEPDVILTDIKMPIMDGIAVTHAITSRFPNVGVMALSMYGETDLIHDMLKAGALGYLTKNAEKAEIYQAIEKAYRYQPFYCRTAQHILARHMVKRESIENTEVQFTEKEKQIMTGICEELSNQELADQLYLGKRTVESYRARIMEKLGVKSTIAVVKYAIKRGIYKL